NKHAAGSAALAPAAPLAELVPHVAIDGNRVDIYFEVAAGQSGAAGAATSTGGSGQRVEAAQVLAAWQSGFGVVLTEGGNQARIPADWLERFGPIIADILAARHERDIRDELPRFA